MKITWGQNLLCKTGVYVRRWVFDFKLFSIRIHHWLKSDDQRNLHDHSWNYLTFVIKGGYFEKSPDGNKLLTAGKFAYYKADHKHMVQVNKGGCWTLLFTGPEIRKFGFWVNGKFRKRNKYHFEWGLHPCD